MDAGGHPAFPNAAANTAGHHMLQQQQQQHQQNQQHQQMNSLQVHQQQSMEVNANKKQVFDRLRRRIETYRQRQNDCAPRFDQAFSGVCEKQSLETNVLQKRFLESKAKRQAKKTSSEKKQSEASLASNLQSSVHVVSLYMISLTRTHFVMCFVVLAQSAQRRTCIHMSLIALYYLFNHFAASQMRFFLPLSGSTINSFR